MPNFPLPIQHQIKQVNIPLLQMWSELPSIFFFRRQIFSFIYSPSLWPSHFRIYKWNINAEITYTSSGRRKPSPFHVFHDSIVTCWMGVFTTHCNIRVTYGELTEASIFVAQPIETNSWITDEHIYSYPLSKFNSYLFQ